VSTKTGEGQVPMVRLYLASCAHEAIQFWKSIGTIVSSDIRRAKVIRLMPRAQLEPY
jgi:hypothetical protein